MTDKQIIIDGIDVSWCEFIIINKDKQMCRCIKSDLFGGIEFVENAKNGNCKDNPNCYYKQLKRKEQECETLASQLDFEVQKKECLEQECEELKKIIDEAKNSKLDLKSFLVGEAVQNEYEQQLDQLKEQCEAYKMEADKGKEINAELKTELEQEKAWHKTSDEISKANSEYTANLKAENEELKRQYKELGQCSKGLKDYFEKEKETLSNRFLKLKQTLTEIKEIAENIKGYDPLAKHILQKISEVEDV